MAGETYLTRDHDTIVAWAKSRGARPVVLVSASDDERGRLRLDFPGYLSTRVVEELSWETWLRRFDEDGLVLLFQITRGDGQESRFNRLILASVVDEAGRGSLWIEHASSLLGVPSRSPPPRLSR